MSKSKSKRLDPEGEDALMSELSGSAFFHPSTSTQVDKPTKPQVEKYTTHLTPATIKIIKVYAAQHDMKDYEVVQQALDLFLSRDESVS